jgi:hypothetical protein
MNYLPMNSLMMGGVSVVLLPRCFLWPSLFVSLVMVRAIDLLLEFL